MADISEFYQEAHFHLSFSSSERVTENETTIGWRCCNMFYRIKSMCRTSCPLMAWWFSLGIGSKSQVNFFSIFLRSKLLSEDQTSDIFLASEWSLSSWVGESCEHTHQIWKNYGFASRFDNGDSKRWHVSSSF